MPDPNIQNSDFISKLKAKYDIMGEAFFVNNSVTPLGGAAGSDSPNNGLSPLQPLATIDYAIGLCTANRGDAIFVLGKHAETVTAPITLDVASVQIIGLNHGNLRPTVTVNGTIDLFTMTAANCRISNLTMTIITTDAATALVNVAAAFCKIDNNRFIPSSTAENVVDVITLASGSSDCLIDNNIGFNTIVAVNSWISIEAASARVHIRNNTFRGNVVTAGIIDSATATQLILEGNKIVTIGTNIPACILDANPTGQAYQNHMYGTDATIANNAQWGTALILGDNFTRGGTGSSVSASDVIPALDT